MQPRQHEGRGSRRGALQAKRNAAPPPDDWVYRFVSGQRTVPGDRIGGLAERLPPISVGRCFARDEGLAFCRQIAPPDFDRVDGQPPGCFIQLGFDRP